MLTEITSLLNQRDYLAALPVIERALAAQPDNISLGIKRGSTLRHLNRLSESCAVFQALLDAHPNNLAIKHEFSVSLRLAGSYDESLRLSEAILREDPRHRAALQGRYDTYAHAKNFALALNAIEHALGVLPDDTLLHIKRGVVLRHLDRLGESRDELQSLLKNNPDNLSIMHELSVTLRHCRAYTESLALSETILRHVPHHQSALLSRVDTCIHAQDFAAALGYAEDALCHLPGSVPLAIKRAAILRQLGRLTESQDTLRTLRDTHPKNLAVLHELSITLRFCGAFAESLAISARMAELDPSHRPALLWGRFDNPRLVIVVGRANSGLGSAALTRLTSRFHERGYSVCFFPYDPSQPNDTLARSLAAFLDLRCGQPTLLLAHSKGAIISTMAAGHMAVSAIIGLGYPFRQPRQPDELERTSHLRAVAKPLLVIQGTDDCYGSAEAARRYPLSASTRIVSVESDHSYNQITDSDYARCAAEIEEILADDGCPVAA